jgi:hypothetical protein
VWLCERCKTTWRQNCSALGPPQCWCCGEADGVRRCLYPSELMAPDAQEMTHADYPRTHRR